MNKLRPATSPQTTSLTAILARVWIPLAIIFGLLLIASVAMSSIGLTLRGMLGPVGPAGSPGPAGGPGSPGPPGEAVNGSAGLNGTGTLTIEVVQANGTIVNASDYLTPFNVSIIITENTTIVMGQPGPPGRDGDNGTDGLNGTAVNGTNGFNGTNGTAATIEIGNVTASPPGSLPTVTNAGTAQNAILDFTLPSLSNCTPFTTIDCIAHQNSVIGAGDAYTPLLTPGNGNYQNAIFGPGAGLALLEGNQGNLLLGYQVMGNATTSNASFNTYAGYRVAQEVLGPDNIGNCGYGAFAAETMDADVSYSVFIGYSTAFNVGPGVTFGTYVGGEAAGFGQSVTGPFMTVVGGEAGYHITSAESSVFVGYRAGFSMTGGKWNVYIGPEAGYHSIDDSNVCIGEACGFSMVGATEVVFIGAATGYNCTSCINDVYIGMQAGYHTTTGSFNVAIGHMALYFNVDGAFMTVTGEAAAYSAISAESCTISGNYAAFNLINGSYNTITGEATCYHLTDGCCNDVTGEGSGKAMTLASYNAVDGYRSLTGLINGNGNTMMGALTGNALVGSESNNSYFGYGVTGEAGESGVTRLGQPGIASAAYMAGVYGTSVSNATAALVFMDASGKLGTATPEAVQTLQSLDVEVSLQLPAYAATAPMVVTGSAYAVGVNASITGAFGSHTDACLLSYQATNRFVAFSMTCPYFTTPETATGSGQITITPDVALPSAVLPSVTDVASAQLCLYNGVWQMCSVLFGSSGALTFYAALFASFSSNDTLSVGNTAVFSVNYMT